MDFVARAKALFANKTRIGLLAVPLAIALPAIAAPVTTLPTSNFTCDAGGTDCTGVSTVQQLALSNNFQGLKFFGPSSGSYALTNFNFSGSSQTLTYSTSGILQTDSFSGSSVPLSYLFSINGIGFGSLDSWTLTYSIFQSGGAFGTKQFTSTSGSVSGTQSGSGDLQFSGVLTAGLFTSVFVSLTATVGNPDGFEVDISVPSSSFDINPVADSVPEPATAGLAGLGIALAGGYRLIRRRKGYVIVKDSTKA